MEAFFDVMISFNKRKGKYKRTVYEIDEKYYAIETSASAKQVRVFIKTKNGKYSETNTLPLMLITQLANSLTSMHSL